jgi:hypothetical protein
MGCNLHCFGAGLARPVPAGHGSTGLVADRRIPRGARAPLTAARGGRWTPSPDG